MKMEQIYETRRERLRQAMQEQFGGKQAAIAARLGRQADYISRIFTGRKMLAEDLAREFEEMLGKPAYWLDGMAKQAGGAWPFSVPLEDYARLDAEDREALDKTLTDLVAGIRSRYELEEMKRNQTANQGNELKPSGATIDAARRSRAAAHEAAEGRSAHGTGGSIKKRSGVSR